MLHTLLSLLAAHAFAATPPDVPTIQATFQKGDLIAQCKTAISKVDERLKAIVAIKPEQRTLENTMLEFEEANADLGDAVLPLMFMRNVSPDENTRTESDQCTQAISEFSNDMLTRRDLYLAMKDQSGRNADEKRLVSETLRSFEENGMNLPDDQLAKYRQLSDQLSKIELDFETNIRKDSTTITVKTTELDGVNPDYLAKQKKSADDTYVLQVREPDFFEIEQNAKNADLRKRMMTAMYNVGGNANIKLLEQAVSVREQLAKILGFKTWADYKLQDHMAKTSATVLNFLGDVRQKLAKENMKQTNEMLKFKQQLDPSAKTLDQWDNTYISTQMQKKQFNIDFDKVREYFPSDVVIPNMLKIYSEMLGVTYKEIANPKVWSPDVKEFEVHDKKDNRLIGFFFMDLYKRPGKPEDAFNAGMIQGRVLKNGHYSYPVAGIVANLEPGGNGKPALLTYANSGEVVTIFHEFGHTMHHTLTRAPYASLSGTSVKTDFVEAPSQMLENWVAQPEILTRLSGHYKDHKKKLPAATLKSLVALRDFQAARFYTRQNLLASYDMNINSQTGPVDANKTYEQLYLEITGLPIMPGIQFPASFHHLMGGYDCGYYGYLWSKVYAQDMFTVFEKTGLTSPVAGAKYRKFILERGNMEDPIELVTKFLGREPSNTPFYKSIGAL